MYCRGINKVLLFGGTISIGDGAFYNCSGLKNITIGGDIISIGDSAFDECSGLKTVYYNGSEKKWTSVTIMSNNNDLLNAKIIIIGGRVLPV